MKDSIGMDFYNYIREGHEFTFGQLTAHLEELDWVVNLQVKGSLRLLLDALVAAKLVISIQEVLPFPYYHITRDSGSYRAASDFRW